MSGHTEGLAAQQWLGSARLGQRRPPAGRLGQADPPEAQQG